MSTEHGNVLLLCLRDTPLFILDRRCWRTDASWSKVANTTTARLCGQLWAPFTIPRKIRGHPSHRQPDGSQLEMRRPSFYRTAPTCRRTVAPLKQLCSILPL